MSRNIILQHWAGDVPEIVTLSRANIQRYAASVGADYEFVTGHPFHPELTAPCQKLVMLSEVWDQFDQVCMIDADMFATTDAFNIFEVVGFGIYHPNAHGRVYRERPALTSMNAPFWGGAIYRFPREHREILRAQFDLTEAKQFNDRGRGEDEGIMHRLALRAGWLHRSENLYFGQYWAWASYDPNPGVGNFIHIRHHDGKGNRVDKVAEYHRLKKLRVIA